MEHKVNISSLKIGMFVSNLDRPWIDTPFLLEGFHIENEDDLDTLNKFCSFVYIDPSRGIVSDDYVVEKPNLKTNSYLERYLQDSKKKVEYEDTKSSKEELPQATIAIDNATIRIAEMMEGLKEGKNLDIDAIKGVVEPILDSIVRNAEAYRWISMMQKKSGYTYSHSVDNCALAITFGRHMGLPKKDLRTLAIGLLMMDMGNLRVPDQILNKKGRLSDAEYKIIQKHVQHSVDILRDTEGMNEDIVNIAITHHERFDGSGYPYGLQGVHIPVYGRMAAIIDCYDAMTSDRPYSPAQSAYSALQDIYNWRGTSFQPELVEQFLQCMGVYPTGSLIEMTNGEVGIVITQNTTQRMRPKIMLLLNEHKEHLTEYKTIDLAKEFEDSSGYPLNVHRGLDPGEHGIDPTEYYL
jgi:HD-GYP domain-containing protein (c-di-GMP phosphodiesterase class II)